MKGIKPIRNEDEYEQALLELRELFMATKGSEEYDRAEILEILIVDYEEKHFIIEEPDPVEAIKYVMEESDLNQAELAKIIGDKSKASLVLNKKRKLSLSMIRKIHESLKVPLDILIKDYPLVQ